MCVNRRRRRLQYQSPKTSVMCKRHMKRALAGKCQSLPSIGLVSDQMREMFGGRTGSWPRANPRGLLRLTVLVLSILEMVSQQTLKAEASPPEAAATTTNKQQEREQYRWQPDSTTNSRQLFLSEERPREPSWSIGTLPERLNGTYEPVLGGGKLLGRVVVV